MSTPALAYAIRGEGSDTLELDVYDTIGETWWGEGVSAKKVRAALKESSASLIKLRVNSRGGDIFDGLAIYSLLVDHPARVEADVDALAASAASVILMAANEIRMSPAAMVMIHNPWTYQAGEADDLRSTAELLDKIRSQMADIYVARTSLDRDRVIEMLDAETWLTAAEAKEHGFADMVKPPPKKSESQAALAALSLRGFDRAPACFAAAISTARASLARANTREDSIMTDEEKALRKRLGLPESATTAEVARAAARQLDELVPKAHVDEAVARATAAEAEIERVREEQRGRDLDALVAQGRKDGKIMPAAEAFFRRSFDGMTPDEAKAALEALPVVCKPGTDPRSDENPPGTKDDPGLTAEQLQIAKLRGMTAEEYSAFLKGEG